MDAHSSAQKLLKILGELLVITISRSVQGLRYEELPEVQLISGEDEAQLQELLTWPQQLSHGWIQATKCRNCKRLVDR